MNNRQSFNSQMHNRNRYNVRNVQENKECACMDKTKFEKSKMYIQNCQCLDDLPLGIAYVPWQKWECILDTKEGLANGTIFSKLIYPFYGCSYNKGGSR